MEKFIEELFSKKIDKSKKDSRWEFEARDGIYPILEGIEDEAMKYNILFNSLKLFIKKADAIKNYYPSLTVAESLDLDNDLFMVFEVLIDKTDFQNMSTKQGLELLEIILGMKRLKYFMGLALRCVREKFYSYEIFQKFSVEESNQFYKLLKIELFPIFPNSKVQPEDYSKEYCELWKYTLESAVNSLEEKQFVKSINVVQELYEFGILNCSNREDCPYVSIADKIVRIRKYVENCTSLYSSLTKSNDKHMLKLMEILKIVLVDDKCQFYRSLIEDFTTEITEVLKISPYKADSLFDKYHKTICETVLDIYIKCKRSDARVVCGRFFSEIIDLIEKMKKHDPNFQLFLINKINEVAVFIKKIENPKDESDENPSKLFQDISRSISFYIREKCTSKTLVAPILDLLISWMNLMSEPSYVYPILNILEKEYYFPFKDHTDKFQLILKNIILMTQKILIIYNEDPEKFEDILRELERCIESLSKYLENNATLINIAQPVLLKDLIGKAIIENIEDESFYKLIREFTNVIDFKYTSSEKDIMFLKEIVRNAASPAIIESIQPDIQDQDEPRNKFYLLFYTRLSCIYETRKDIADEIEKDVCNLLEKIDSLDNYDNEIRPGNLTINYYILETFVSQIMEQHSKYKNMIKFLTPIVLRLYAKHKNVSDVKSTFTRFLIEATKENYDVLVPSASKFWELFLEEKDISTYLTVLQTTLPNYISDFTKNFASKYFAYVLSKQVQTTDLLNNFNLIQIIANSNPSCLLEKLNGSNDIFFQKLIEKVKPLKDGMIIYFIVDVYSKLANEAKDKQHFNVLFSLRTDIINILYFGTNQNLNDLKSIASKKQLDISSIIYPFTTALAQIGTNLADNNESSNTKELIKDLIRMSKVPYEKREYIFETIKAIACFGNRVFLIKEYKTYFEGLKNNSNANVKQIAVDLCDFIDGRNLEKFEKKLVLNTVNITEIKKDVKEADKKMDKLETTVKTQDSKIKTVQTEVGTVNTKLVNVDQRLEQQDKRIDLVDDKTLLNVPLWAKGIANFVAKDWVLLAKRLNFTQKDINSWSTQADPFMAVLQEWYTINKSSEATVGLIKILREMNQKESVKIIEKHLDIANVQVPNEDDIDKKLIDLPPQIFMSFQWSVKDKVELLKQYIEKEKFSCWADMGQMGGGNARNERIDRGLRAANVIVCFITTDYAKDETSLKQINLAVTLNKPIIPLLMEKGLKWAPAGSLGPILSGYLFIRFYQRQNEATNDERYWPIDKFDELIMQLKHTIPSPIPPTIPSNASHPVIFISYQWGKQKEVTKLFTKLTTIHGLTCWLDIKQMSGGDTLYEKIDTGIRNCHCMISCITEKYSLSANCRKELLLADSIKKPIIPILLEPSIKYPPSGPMSPILATLKYVDFTKDLNEQNSWDGKCFDQLLERINQYLPNKKPSAKVLPKAEKSKSCSLL